LPSEQRDQAELPDGERHRSEGSEGCELHQDGDDPRHHLRDGFAQANQAIVVVQRDKGQPTEYGQKQYRKHLALGKGAAEAVRDDVQDEIAEAEMFRVACILGDGLHVEGCGIYIHPSSRLKDRCDGQSDQQGEGGYDFKVDQRFDADAAQSSCAADVGDSNHNGEEDDGRDHHADELDEDVAQGPQLFAGAGREDAYKNSENDANDHSKVQGSKETA
jgi:hypothetical protein